MARLEEVWVELDGYPDYAVSNYGGVLDMEFDQDVDTHISSDGDITVKLEIDGDMISFLVKRLVAEAFFMDYQYGVEIIHINGNKEDCSILNLTLGTRKVAKRA